MVRATPLAAVLLGLSCAFIFLGQDIRIGVRIRAFDLGLLAVTVLMIWQVARQGVRRDVAPLIFAYGAFVTYAFSNAMLQSGTGTAIKELVQLTFFGLFFLAMTQNLRSEQAVLRFMAVFLAGLWLLGLHNAGYHVMHGAYSGWKELGDRKLVHSVLFVLMVVWALSPLRPKGAWWVPALILSIVLMLLAGERKGWAAAVVAVVIVSLVSDAGGVGRRGLARTAWTVAIGGGVVVCALMVAPFVPYLDKQLSSLGEFIQLFFADEAARGAADTTQSNQNRLALIQIALQHIQNHPVFGIGPEQFVRSSARLPFLPVPVDELKGAHNELLRITAELGFVGLGFYLFLNGVIAARAGLLIANMARLNDAERLFVRLGFAMFLFGFAVNVFLAGGGLNTFFVLFPAGLLYAVRLRTPSPAAASPISTMMRPEREPDYDFG